MWHDLLGSELDQDAFREFLYSTARGVTDAYVIYAPTPDGNIPVALGSFVERPKWIEPHMDFFPWASDRNKLETGVKLVLELRKKKPLFMAVPRKFQRWTDQMLKYGVMRRAGTHEFTNQALYESGVK